MRAARAASALITEIPLRRLVDIEEGDRIPVGDDLNRFAEAHGVDSYSISLGAVSDLA